MDSYSHFTSDIWTKTVAVTSFEVGAHTGHINQDNMKRLHTLHTFCTKVNLKYSKENIFAISILSSYKRVAQKIPNRSTTTKYYISSPSDGIFKTLVFIPHN
jgi:hypothetical protein